MSFQPPSRKESLRAIGRTEHLPETLKRALEPDDDFEPIPAPKPGDWLAEHDEPGQSFEEYERNAPVRLNSQRRTIMLQPLGQFDDDRSPSLESLRTFASSFFRLETVLGQPLPLAEAPLTTRTNPMTRNRQVLTRDVLAWLKKRRPSEAICVLAITMEDLYPDPSWNFVFGQASPRDRIGVFSFARYDPAFLEGKKEVGDYKVLLRRSCKVLAHETGHLFSLAHCLYFRCLMNGSNHLRESDLRPLALCPVCQRKLHFSIGFDVLDRYKALLHFYRQIGFEHEAEWVAKRLSRIEDQKEKP